MSPHIKVQIVTGLAVGIAMLLQPAFCQQAGQGQAPPPSPAPGGGGRTPPGGPTPPGGQQPFPGGRDRGQMPPLGDDRQRSPYPEQRAIFLSGKVMLDDGTPPSEPLVIELVCNGMPRPQAYTDSKGRFSFQLGQNQSMMQDASYGSAADPGLGAPGGFGGMGRPAGGNRGGFDERALTGCELRAVLPGFRSEQVNLSGRRAFDNPDVGTIVLHRLGNVEGTTISATSLQAPKDAKKAFEKGRDAVKKKKLEEAEKNLQKAVEIYPKYAVAWFELGLVQEQQTRFEEARKSYAQALAADAKYISPYLQMALISAREKKWQEAADTTDRAVRLNPFDFPQAYFYNSVANYNLGKLDAAEKSAREAQKLDSQHRFPRIDQLLGIILAQKRDFSGAAEQMRSYLKFAPEAADAAAVKTQLTELEKLSGSTAKSSPQQ